MPVALGWRASGRAAASDRAGAGRVTCCGRPAGRGQFRFRAWQRCAAYRPSGGLRRQLAGAGGEARQSKFDTIDLSPQALLNRVQALPPGYAAAGAIRSIRRWPSSICWPSTASSKSRATLPSMSVSVPTAARKKPGAATVSRSAPPKPSSAPATASHARPLSLPGLRYLHHGLSVWRASLQYPRVADVRHQGAAKGLSRSPVRIPACCSTVPKLEKANCR